MSAPLCQPFEVALPPVGENHAVTVQEVGTPEHPIQWITDIRHPLLTVYLPQHNPTKTGVIVVPGGGYGGHAVGHEGQDIARWFETFGVATFVLRYRLPQREAALDPLPLQDAREALRTVRTVRANAQAWGVNPQRIGVMGFSAGGHLASMTGTLLDASDRPNFLLLVYPVISMRDDATHRGSRENLLGDQLTPALIERFSTDEQVTAQTPPTFLVHSRDDEAVPLENTLRFARALEREGIAHETAIYELGGHGYGLAHHVEGTNEWPSRCIAWLRERGFLDPSKSV